MDLFPINLSLQKKRRAIKIHTILRVPYIRAPHTLEDLPINSTRLQHSIGIGGGCYQSWRKDLRTGGYHQGENRTVITVREGEGLGGAERGRVTVQTTGARGPR